MITRSKFGFAMMDPEQQRRLASLGGKAAHAQGRAFHWTSEEAKDAGRKGGLETHRRRKARKAAEEQPS